MPIYEYRCKECGVVSEFLINIDKDDAISCKICGSLEMERVMSPASFKVRSVGHAPGKTCCGREERCDTPPCSEGEFCRRA